MYIYLEREDQLDLVTALELDLMTVSERDRGTASMLPRASQKKAAEKHEVCEAITSCLYRNRR